MEQKWAKEWAGLLLETQMLKEKETGNTEKYSKRWWSQSSSPRHIKNKGKCADEANEANEANEC